MAHNCRGQFVKRGFSGICTQYSPADCQLFCWSGWSPEASGNVWCNQSSRQWVDNLSGCTDPEPGATPCTNVNINPPGYLMNTYCVEPGTPAANATLPSGASCELGSCDIKAGYNISIYDAYVMGMTTCDNGHAYVNAYGCGKMCPIKAVPGYTFHTDNATFGSTGLLQPNSGFHITCAPGWTGIPNVSVYGCTEATPTVPPLSGCTPPPPCVGWAGEGIYAAGTCADVPHGQLCHPECSFPWVGFVRGSMKCNSGEIEPNEPLAGCELVKCPAYNQVGYQVTNCGVGTENGTLCNAICAAGFEGKLNGQVECSTGEYFGSFGGCRPQSTATCAAPFVQTGYKVAAACGAGAQHGTVCTADACASGYSGTPSGKATCVGTTWIGVLSGCGRATDCSMPAWLCDAATGKVTPAYTTTSYGLSGVVETKSCVFGDMTLLSVACAPGYTLAGGTLATTVCLRGTKTFGFANGNPPICELRPKDECSCGKSGERVENMRINKGRVRAPPPGWNGPGHTCWEDAQDGKREVRCFCQCRQ